jgi:adenosylmethionine-8-amino-7-oxononanoate aminotransferase
MGATLASDEIYQAFHSADRARMFFHSTSFTGNAIACAAAVANLEVFEREPVAAHIEAIAKNHRAALELLRGKHHVAGVRQCGTIAAVELMASDSGYFAALGPNLNRFYLERDVLLRSLGNVVYLLPPYCTSTNELDRIYDVISESLTLVAS